LLAVEESGFEVDALLEMPAVREDLIEYYDAFTRLSARRQTGMSGPSPISELAIEAYFRLYRVPKDEELSYLHWIDFLDGVWLTWVSKNQKRR